jgi:thioesterase domain-containing protein/acyl carrier protein
MSAMPEVVNRTSRSKEAVPDIRSQPALDILTQIWRDVLQLPNIDKDADFFDLGGDSALALELFGKIADRWGQQFPPVMIYHVRTVAAQAALLQQPSTPELSPLIMLKSGQRDSSLFIAPGLGGGPAEFFQLVKYVRTTKTVFGLQPRGIEGFDTPCERIEDMAEFYLNSILHYQPRGPYYLAGYSLGGLVALEMARALMSKGQDIALLLMMDSYPDIQFLARTQRLLLSAQRMMQRGLNFVRPKGTRIRLGGLPSQDAISTFAPAFDRVRDAAYKALRQYKPQFYGGAVKFIRAAEVTDFPANPSAIWSGLMGNLEVETAPGDHLGMLTNHHESVALLLNRYLEEATAKAVSRTQPVENKA